MEIKTIQDIEQLISNSVLENTSLEYKGGIDIHSKKNWQKELAKDVSAMANANGGIIIYGVQEYQEETKRHLPEKITPIDTTEISKERIEQVIYNNISPKINGIEISCIVVDKTKPNEVLYVVNIPQGDTAHQNTVSHKYYKRRNTTIEEMEDYEIRDIMNRNTTPNVHLDFAIEIHTQTQSFVMQPVSDQFGNVIPQMIPNLRVYNVLCCTPHNVGPVIAEHVHYFLEIPFNLIADPNSLDIIKRENGYVTIHCENLYYDILKGSTIANVKFGNPRVIPILPETTGVSYKTLLNAYSNFNSCAEIRWTLLADCAKKKSGAIRICDIPRINIQ